ncbi:hypothetical protein Scep_015333 [Stephania cephalantha]|uniref:Apple domain-containing protein n=1 Tax=Stephania cephalantha TaxID=152367 RepID=A0AAP0P0A2_9MAGN
MRATHLCFIISALLLSLLRVRASTLELAKGFAATPDSSISSFQSFLVDPNGNFSFGFLRIQQSQLALAVLHAASSEPIWVANTSTTQWADSTTLIFNGSLILSNSKTGTHWSTRSEGDRLVLRNNSNLQIQKFEEGDTGPSIPWQSFDSPSNTLIENQNFTANMSLVNGAFSMKLGGNFIGLYTNFINQNQIYWKHTAMEAKASIIQGEGPIYARISPNGFLGTYQNEKAPVDVLPFNTFQRPTSGISLIRLESDGNLKSYYWNGSAWILDFTAITEDCELPNFCGQFAVCTPGNGCECLNNKTEYHRPGDCARHESQQGSIKSCTGHSIIRKTGVELPYKELMEFEKMGSLSECESDCERNCSCRGAVYNNGSGYCYRLEYEIGTLVGVGDEEKIGYFKVVGGEGRWEEGTGVCCWCGVGCGGWSCRGWDWCVWGVEGVEEEDEKREDGDGG